MKVKLQPASRSDLPVFNPILPLMAITQIMLIANPNQVSAEKMFNENQRSYSVFNVFYFNCSGASKNQI
jgi:hypothetical protein